MRNQINVLLQKKIRLKNIKEKTILVIQEPVYQTQKQRTTTLRKKADWMSRTGMLKGSNLRTKNRAKVTKKLTLEKMLARTLI